jgi:cbb3-type cytochrome oxidase subunit 3
MNVFKNPCKSAFDRSASSACHRFMGIKVILTIMNNFRNQRKSTFDRSASSACHRFMGIKVILTIMNNFRNQRKSAFDRSASSACHSQILLKLSVIAKSSMYFFKTKAYFWCKYLKYDFSPTTKRIYWFKART